MAARCAPPRSWLRSDDSHASPYAQSILTRVQEISLSYHIKCEQYARFATGAFFNFNGTGGVWRKECIEKSGGWNARTTVEDMDLSLRAYLQGWRFVFLYDVTVRVHLAHTSMQR